MVLVVKVCLQSCFPKNCCVLPNFFPHIPHKTLSHDETYYLFFQTHLGKGLISAGAKLEVLDLSDNASGPIGVEGFSELLNSPVCYSLKELRLNNMGLGITGAKV